MRRELVARLSRATAPEAMNDQGRQMQLARGRNAAKSE
jgi:hypothetical protein